MKKLSLLFFFICTLLTTACSDDFNPYDKQPINNVETKEKAIIEAAINARTFFFSEKSRKPISSADVTYITSRESRSGDLDTLIYAVNFEDGKGFALLSAVEANMPLLAVTDCGVFNTNGNNNIGVTDFVKRAQDKLIAIKDTTNKVGDKSHLMFVETIRDTLSFVNIPKKVSIRWGQDGSHAKYCPYPPTIKKRATGCVPTAIAMIMSYFEYPQTITWTAPEIPKDSENLKWKDMKVHDFERTNCPNNTRGWCEATQDAHLQIAKIMREIGYIGSAKYEEGTNSASKELEPFTMVDEPGTMAILKKFGFKHSSYVTFKGVNENLLAANNILLISARNGDSSSTGHCFIVDGCWKLVVKTTENVYDTFFNPWVLVSSRFSTNTNCYMHINWGYDGDSNGYYLDKVFDSTKVTKLDDESRVLRNDTASYNNVRYLPVGIY